MVHVLASYTGRIAPAVTPSCINPLLVLEFDDLHLRLTQAVPAAGASVYATAFVVLSFAT